VPTLAELGSHECAINWADKILYVKADDGGLTSIALGGSSTLPTASSNVLGGIKVGSGLTITNGVLAATGGGSGGSANIVEATTAAGFPATGSAGTLYHATDSSRIYFYDASGVYVEVGTSGGGGSGSLSATVTIPATGDQYWDSTVLLLKGDGNLTDSSSYGRTVTNYGAAANGTAKFGSNSLSFSGSSSYLRAAIGTASSLPGDFTMETWVYFNAAPSSFEGAYGACIMATYPASGGSGGWGLRINGTSTSYTTINLYTGTTDLNWTGTFAINQWHHVAVTRSGSSIRAFVDGVQAGSTATCSDNMDSSGADVWVGRLNASPYFFQLNGRLDDLRITKGVARAFTPPVATAAIGTYTAPQTLPVVFDSNI